VSAGKALGVTGTPTVFIGLNAGKALVSSTRIVGARTVTVYTEAIDELLLNRKE